MPGLHVLEMMRSRKDEWLDALAILVAHESPSREKPSLDLLGRHLAGRFEAIGGSVQVVSNNEGGNHFLARFFETSSDRKPTLILGHYDTVWPIGTLATMPFRIENGKAFGPGVFDMKASLIEAEFAIDSLIRLDRRPSRPVLILITSDEEVGSPTSRRLIEETATECEHVLVLEPPLPDGSLKTARKGVGHFVIEVEGKSAHAGVEPSKGLSAILELAHQILYLHGMTDLEAGVSVNVGVITGGTTPNVVAAHASAQVDVRATTLEQAKILEQAHPPGAILHFRHQADDSRRLQPSAHGKDGIGRQALRTRPGNRANHGNPIGRGLDRRADRMEILRPPWASPRSTAWVSSVRAPMRLMSRSRLTRFPSARPFSLRY